MPLTPIERMIDAACGVTGEIPAPQARITLRCPVCKKTMSGPRDDIDPPQAVTIEYPCPECQKKGAPETLQYLDAKGEWVNLEREE